MTGKRIILIDVDEHSRQVLFDAGLRDGHEVATATDWTHLAQVPSADLIVHGANGNDREICERVRRVRSARPESALVVIEERLSTDTIVDLMRLQTSDVVGLPQDAEVLASRVFQSFASEMSEDVELLGESPVMRDLRREVMSLKSTRSTVLLTGEPGAGKGAVARWISRSSDPQGAPFVRVDCASVSVGALGADLLPADMERADDGRITPGSFFGGAGTIYLERVSELNPTLQARLASILSRRAPINERGAGGRGRIIASTHSDLAGEVEAQRFRADLFFSLSILRVQVPALRDRIEDLPSLVDGMLGKIAARLIREVPKVDSSFLERLSQHPFPGNLQELSSVLERALLNRGRLDGELAEQVLEAPRAPVIAPNAGNGALLPSDDELGLGPEDALERSQIAEVLRETAGNVARAARRLEMPRSTLRYRIRRYALGALIPRD